MRIIGIDPGIYSTTVASLTFSDNTPSVEFTHEIYSPFSDIEKAIGPDRKPQMQQILIDHFDWLTTMLQGIDSIDSAFMENAYFSERSSVKDNVAQVQGVILLCFGLVKTEVSLLAPTTIKAQICGGRSSKKVIRDAVAEIVGDPIFSKKSSHCADAIAAAIAGYLLS